MTTPRSYHDALMVRAKQARDLGDREAVRVLTGYADTIRRDPAAAGRLRSALTDRCKVYFGPAAKTPEALLWTGALADLRAQPATTPRALAPSPPPLSPAPASKKTAPPAAAPSPEAYVAPAAPVPADVIQAAVEAAVAPLRAEVAALRERISRPRKKTKPAAQALAPLLVPVQEQLAGIMSTLAQLASRPAVDPALLAEVEGHAVALAAHKEWIETTVSSVRGLQQILADRATQALVQTPAIVTPAEPPVITMLRSRPLPDGKTWLDVVQEESERHGVEVRDVMGDTKSRPVSAARQAVWARLYRYPGTKYSLPFIAKAWSANHTSVRYAIQKAEAIEQVPPAPKSGPRVACATAGHACPEKSA